MLPGRPRDRLLSWTLSNTRREAWVKLRNNCVDEAQFERDRESSRAVRVTVAQERP